MNEHERISYDEQLDAGHVPGDCPVCDEGCGNPCSEACAFEMRRLRLRGLMEQAKLALDLARRYREEEGPGGRRERACLDVVAGCRLRIRQMRGAA